MGDGLRSETLPPSPASLPCPHEGTFPAEPFLEVSAPLRPGRGRVLVAKETQPPHTHTPAGETAEGLCSQARPPQASCGRLCPCFGPKGPLLPGERVLPPVRPLRPPHLGPPSEEPPPPSSTPVILTLPSSDPRTFIWPGTLCQLMPRPRLPGPGSVPARRGAGAPTAACQTREPGSRELSAVASRPPGLGSRPFGAVVRSGLPGTAGLGPIRDLPSPRPRPPSGAAHAWGASEMPGPHLPLMVSLCLFRQPRPLVPTLAIPPE